MRKGTPLTVLAVALLVFGAWGCGKAGKERVSAGVATSIVAPGATPSTTSGATEDTSRQEGRNTQIGYGREASGAVRREIVTLVNRYYAAAAADDGGKACSLIYSVLAESIPEDYGRSPGPRALRGKTCAVVMSKLFKHLPNQSPAVLANTRVTGVRVNGNHGLVRLSSPAIPTGQIIVQREGRTWKIDTLIGGRVP